MSKYTFGIGSILIGLLTLYEVVDTPGAQYASAFAGGIVFMLGIFEVKHLYKKD